MNSEAFAALAHELRLDVFRLLIGVAPDGLPAGQIAMQLDVPASTLSTHLAQLERAGLIKSSRDRQRIMYSIDAAGTQALVGFLVNDCCGGEPKLCGFGVRTKRASKRA